MMDQLIFQFQENLLVSSQNLYKFYWILFLKCLCLHTGIEVQLLSQADVDRGDSVIFPVNADNIPVQSEIPSSTISE